MRSDRSRFRWRRWANCWGEETAGVRRAKMKGGKGSRIYVGMCLEWNSIVLCVLAFGLYECTERKHDGECVSEPSRRRRGGFMMIGGGVSTINILICVSKNGNVSNHWLVFRPSISIDQSERTVRNAPFLYYTLYVNRHHASLTRTIWMWPKGVQLKVTVGFDSLHLYVSVHCALSLCSSYRR